MTRRACDYCREYHANDGGFYCGAQWSGINRRTGLEEGPPEPSAPWWGRCPDCGYAIWGGPEYPPNYCTESTCQKVVEPVF